jgi:KDO2-lipid IV(A) lauroyltransferase
MIEGLIALRRETVAVAYALGWAATKRVPEPVARATFDQIAAQIWRRHGNGVRQLAANLARAAPDAGADELDELTRQAVRSYLRYWLETFRLPVWSDVEVVGRVRTINETLLRDAYADGGALVALPHMANWDHAGAWACLTGMPVTTVAEHLAPERLFRQFVGYRESLGMEVLALSAGQDAFRTLISRLRTGHLVCLVADRDLSATGLAVELLGHPARLPAGPAVLSRMTGAALIPATLSYDGPHLVIRLHQRIEHQPGPAGVLGMTQRLADAFSAGIRQHPSDWHMMQRVFVSDLGGGPSPPSRVGPA